MNAVMKNTVRDRIHDLVSKGKHDARIASILTKETGLPWSRRRVCRHRQALGLRHNPHPRRYTTGKNGINLATVTRIREEHREITILGWEPLLADVPDLRLIEARILTALDEHGTLTRNQLREHLHHRLYTRQGKSWLMNLCRRGLILVRLKNGAASKPREYMLAPGLTRLQRARRDNRVDKLGKTSVQ